MTAPKICLEPKPLVCVQCGKPKIYCRGMCQNCYQTEFTSSPYKIINKTGAFARSKGRPKEKDMIFGMRLNGGSRKKY